MTAQKRKLLTVLALAWVTYTVSYMCRVNISTALDKLAFGMDVSLDYLGMASSVYFITYAFGQLLNGFWGDHVDPHRFLIAACLLSGAINTTLGLQSNGTVFFILWSMNGFCQSMFWSTLLRLLSAYAEDGQRKNVSTIMSTCSATGYLISWVILSDLFMPYSYRPYFLVPGLIALLLVLGWFAMMQALPFEQEQAKSKTAPPLPVVIGEIRHDRLYFVCLLCVLVGTIKEGAVFWLPKIFTDVLGFGEGSLIFLMLVPLAKLAGVFAARRLLTMVGESVKRGVQVMLSIGCASCAALVLTSSHTSLLTLALIALLLAVINGANWFMISYLPLHFAERNIVATLVGCFDFSTYIGASVMTGVVGVALARFSWVALPLMWLGITCVALLLACSGAGTCLGLKGKRRAA